MAYAGVCIFFLSILYVRSIAYLVMHVLSLGMGSTAKHAAIVTEPENALALRDLSIVPFLHADKGNASLSVILSFYNADELQCENLCLFFQDVSIFYFMVQVHTRSPTKPCTGVIG